MSQVGRVAIRLVLWLPLVLPLFAAGCGESIGVEQPRGEGPKAPARHALLVGCTRYDHRDKIAWLEGPRHDVAAMQRLLIRKYGFLDANVVILSEQSGPKNRPIRHRIEEEFRKLAQVAEKDDQVVILLAGHGSQQPDQKPPQPNDPEPDGLDEIFLPADVADWNRTSHHVDRAIIDDELRDWTARILAKGAFVTVIFDCCRSGTALRGELEEVRREIDPDTLGIPPEELKSAEDGVGGVVRGRGEALSFDAGRGSERLTALYASQSNEPTVELPMPPDRTRHGLFSYTLCAVLQSATDPLSNRELLRRICAQYSKMGRTMPTPLLEGGQLDRDVFGQTIVQTVDWRPLTKSKEGRWTVDAGQLDGLSRGCVLAVHDLNPASGAPEKDPVGHVKAEIEPGIVKSEVQPCEFGKLKLRRDLPIPSVCRPVFLDYGELKLRVAVDATEETTRSAAAELEARLREQSQAEGVLFRVVGLAESPQWIIRPRDEAFELLPASAWQIVKESAWPEGTPRFSIESANAPAAAAKRLGQIARGQNLLRIAGERPNEVLRSASVRSTRDLNVVVEMRRYANEDDREGVAIDEAHPVFRAGDWVGWKITNRGTSDVDMTLLFVDSDSRIHALFPEEAKQASCRLAPNAMPILVGPKRVNENTVGRENVVAIAVRASDEIREFTNLAADTRDEATRRGGDDEILTEGLGALLDRGVYGQRAGSKGTDRGLGDAEVQKYRMDLISWSVTRIVSAPAQAAATNAVQTKPDDTPPPDADAGRKALARLTKLTVGQKPMLNVSPEAIASLLHSPWRPGEKLAASEERVQGDAEIRVFADRAPSIVLVMNSDGSSGTGFLVERKGQAGNWLITNDHVIESAEIDAESGARTAKIFLGTRGEDGLMQLNEKPQQALVYASSPAKDLAVLKLDKLPENFKSSPLVLAAAVPANGTNCLAIGHPKGGALWTLRTGIVSSVIDFPSGAVSIVRERLLLAGDERNQLDAALKKAPSRKIVLSTCGIGSGDSGGPLLNEEGEVIAVTNAVPSEEGAARVGYHVHVDELREFLKAVPQKPERFIPDAWQDAPRVDLLDLDEDGTLETLITAASDKSPVALYFDLDDDGSPAKLAAALRAGKSLKDAWDFECALHFSPVRRAFFDTDNDGTVDLIQNCWKEKTQVELILRLKKKQWTYETVDSGKTPLALLDKSGFEDQALEKRLRTLFRRLGDAAAP